MCIGKCFVCDPNHQFEHSEFNFANEELTSNVENIEDAEITTPKIKSEFI